MLSKLLRRPHSMHNQRGDTIVEVLIAIGIVSLVLTGAYMVTNKNSAVMQGTQERIEAQHIAEGQIEALLAHNGLDATGDCFDNTGNDLPGSGPGCTQMQVADSGAIYSVNIQGPTASVYTINVSWTSLASKTNNDSTITMYYRLTL